MGKLRLEHVMTIQVLHERQQSNTVVAETLRVTEGAVRYHIKRAESGARDGRVKVHRIEQLGLAEVVASWWETETKESREGRPPSVDGLYTYLCEEHSYADSYKAVLRYVRAKFPGPKLRPFRRVETPAGAQSQTDWAVVTIDIGDPEGPTQLYALVMRLSHSRKKAVVWSRGKDQLSWLRCHNEAYKRLRGVAAVNRVDNEKTAIARGAGPWGEINEVYRAYSRTLRFHIDACEAYSPEQKGKAERGVADVKDLKLERHGFLSLEHLQEHTDAKVEAQAQRRICPATGKTVRTSWEAEIPFLTGLPESLPEPFDLVRDCPVHKDCTIRFEGRCYVVPFKYVHGLVEVHGCAGFVQVLDRKSGQVLVSYPRGTAARILIDPRCYEGPATERVEAPKPLGRMSRKLLELAAQPVQRRGLELYAELAEVAR